MSMNNIGSLSATSFQDNLNNGVGEYDEFDLNLEKDTVATLLENEDDIQALAEAIIEDTGAKDLPLADLVLYIKAQAQNAPRDINIQTFMSSVIVDLKALAEQDASLSANELETGITKEQQQTNPTELTQFLKDVLTSIADSNGNLAQEDAPLLAALLGIEEAEAQDFITKTDGSVAGLVDVFAGKDGDANSVSYADLDAIKNN